MHMQFSSFAQRIAVSTLLPRHAVSMQEKVNIGFLAPLSGPVSSWGKPGLNGCHIWQDWLNNAGGILIDGKRYPVEIHAYDCEYDPQRAKAGAKHLVQDSNIHFLLMLGGESYSQLNSYLVENKILTSTLLPSDLSAETRYLIAPSEIHPFYNVTAVDWIKRAKPHVKTVALCSQNDALGRPSLATYRAAFRVAGIEIVHEAIYDPSDPSAAKIVDPMLAAQPDLLCWCSSYTPMVHAMTEHAFHREYSGEILSCTLDDYAKLIAKTSIEFVEGIIFQFPDFDDPKLRKKAFFFNQPQMFYSEYNRRFPNNWSAVSWEFAAVLDVWHAAVEKVGSTNSISVLAAMKSMGQFKNAFGRAQWWGTELLGVDNALVGDWPVVTIQNGKAQIVEFGSVPKWLAKHTNILKQEFQKNGQLWRQRVESGDTSSPINARSLPKP